MRTEKIIVGIDGNEANVEKRVGVNVYGFELLWNLWKLQAEWGQDLSLIVYLKNNPLPDMPKETQNFMYRVIPGGGNWILTKLTPDLYLNGPRPNVFFSPSHYVPFLAPMPLVCSIMDLGYLEFSGQFRKKDFWQLKWWSAISIFVSKAILSISKSTKDDIVRHYPGAHNKIYVSPLGYDTSKFNTDISKNDVRRVRNKYSIVDDYVLYLGTLKPSKNIEGLIEAISKVEKIKLVIAGKKGWLYESIFNRVEDLGLKDRVIFTDFIPEEDKPGLIKGAKVFALPSFWEGFGLDALSAMAAGVPVVVSNVGSLPEVVGEAGIQIDPYNIDSIADGIRSVISLSNSKYNELSKKCVQQATKFSWETTARKTLELLKKVCSETKQEKN